MNRLSDNFIHTLKNCILSENLMYIYISLPNYPYISYLVSQKFVGGGGMWAAAVRLRFELLSNAQ